MPVRFVGNQGLRTNNTTAPGGAAVGSFQLWVQVANLDHPSKRIFGKEYTSPFSITPETNADNGVYTKLQFNDGGGSRTYRPLLLPNISYHIAGRYNNGEIAFFVNGSKVYSQTVSASSLVGGLNHAWCVGSFGGSFDIVLDDICFWTGYALSDQEVKDLRDRRVGPTGIGTSTQRVICWSLDGVPGNTVSLADAGVKGGINASSLVGAPVYVAGELVYTPPARLRSAYVGESRKTLILTLETNQGASTTVSDVQSHPSVSLNGLAPVSLGNPPPLWSSNYILYPLPFEVPLGASLTATAAENWANTAVGYCGPLVDAVVITEHTKMFARVKEEVKSMEVGVNLRGPEYYDVVPLYANLVKQGNSGWTTASGSPVYTMDDNFDLQTLSNGELGFLVLSPVASGVGNPDQNHVNTGSGLYRLMWDGASNARLFGSAQSITETAYEPTGALNNRRVYQIQTRTSPYHTQATVVAGGPDVRNLRLYGPGVPEDWTSQFHPELIKKIRGAAVVRFMDAWETNNSNISSYDRFTPRSRRSYGGSRLGSNCTLTTVEPYTGNANYWLANRLVFVCTTAAPHGLKTGEIVTFENTTDAIALTNGSSKLIPNKHVSQVLVISSTKFAASVYMNPSSTVAGTQTFRGKAYTQIKGGMPPEDVIELCTGINADPWICVPHILDDAGIDRLADLFAEHLPRHRRVYVEYSNECWNFGISFLQSEYCHGQGSLEGLSSFQWYAKKTAQVHSRFAARFAHHGRPATDIVRVYGTQVSSSSTAVAILDYAKTQNYQVDALACAPYFVVGPRGFASTYDAVDIDQLMDISSLSIKGYPFGPLDQHRRILQARYPNARLVCYEGGLEQGVPNWNYPSAAAAKSRAWSRHPRIFEQTLRYLQNMQDAGCDLFCWYSLNIYHGTLELPFGATWGLYAAAWNMEDGLGDGSDGKFDNRTGYDNLRNIVSVMGAAIKRWYGWMPERRTAEQRMLRKPLRITPAQIMRKRRR